MISDKHTVVNNRVVYCSGTKWYLQCIRLWIDEDDGALMPKVYLMMIYTQYWCSSHDDDDVLFLQTLLDWSHLQKVSYSAK